MYKVIDMVIIYKLLAFKYGKLDKLVITNYYTWPAKFLHWHLISYIFLLFYSFSFVLLNIHVYYGPYPVILWILNSIGMMT